MESMEEMDVEVMKEYGHVMIKMELDFLDLMGMVGDDARKVMKRFKSKEQRHALMNYILDYHMGSGRNVTFHDLPEADELDYFIAKELEEKLEEDGVKI